MIKKLSYPPVIVLLDLLFIFLFISILDQKSMINISFPSSHLPKDIKVVYLDSSTGIHYHKKNIIESSKSFLLWDCGTQPECLLVKNDYGVAGKILLPDSLFEKISRISSLAFIGEHCRHLDFDIISSQDNKAVIDYSLLGKNNKCLSSMKGYGDWIENKK